MQPPQTTRRADPSGAAHVAPERGLPEEPAGRGGGGGAAELVLALAGLLFLAWFLGCRLEDAQFQAADDAFITYVYGRNVAEGHGLRYNPTDELPTSGASTLLHVLLSAAAIELGVDPLVATRALGILLLVAVAVALGLAAARVARAPPGAGLLAGAAVVFCFALLPETGIHLASGMETLLFTALHAFAFAWAALAVARPRRIGIAAGLAAALVLLALTLARPEGGLLAAGYLAAVLVARSTAPDGRPAAREARWLAPVWLPFVALAIGYVVWHATYFGHLLPNPYFVKASNGIFGSSGSVLPGFDTTWRFAVLRFLPLLALAAVLAAWVRPPREAWRSAAWLLAPSAVVLALYARAIHEMAGGFRYEYPLLVPLVGAAVTGATALQGRSRARYGALLLSAAVAAPLLYSPVRGDVLHWIAHPRSSALGWLQGRRQGNALERLGLDLAQTGLGQRATVLLSAAGQVPWHSRFRSIDWIGLNDTTMSGREPLSLDEVWTYIASQRPDAVMTILPPAAPGSGSKEADPNFQSPNVRRTRAGRGSALFEHWDRERLEEMFWREMVFVRENCVFGAAYELGDAWGDDWWVLAYVARNSPHREALLEALRGSERADRESDLGEVFPFDPRELR